MASAYAHDPDRAAELAAAARAAFPAARVSTVPLQTRVTVGVTVRGQVQGFIAHEAAADVGRFPGGVYYAISRSGALLGMSDSAAAAADDLRRLG